MNNYHFVVLIWMVNKICDNPMTRQEIFDAMAKDYRFQEEAQMSDRTFRNYKKDIEEIFGVDIVRTKDYKFSIDKKLLDETTLKIIRNFDQTMLLNDNIDLKDRILLEDIPEGADLLDKVLCAIRKGRCISFTYTNFGCDPVAKTGAPYCVKLFERRWYVVVNDTEGETLPYCLDRVSDLSLTKESFTLPADFSPKDFFKHSVGVRVVPGEEPVKVRLRVDTAQVPYLRALPLHPTQREVASRDEYCVFDYRVVPTVELRMKILSMAPFVEVWEPQSLCDEVKACTKILFYNCFGEERECNSPYKSKTGEDIAQVPKDFLDRVLTGEQKDYFFWGYCKCPAALAAIEDDEDGEYECKPQTAELLAKVDDPYLITPPPVITFTSICDKVQYKVAVEVTGIER